MRLVRQRMVVVDVCAIRAPVRDRRVGSDRDDRRAPADGYGDLRRDFELFSVFAGVAILISALGLVGLAAHARTKEIGVRKVLGSGRARDARAPMSALERQHFERLSQRIDEPRIIVDSLAQWLQSRSSGSTLEPSMPVNLSVKNVPDELAEQLRRRAATNRRSLQRELLSILEAAVGHRTPFRTRDAAGDQAQRDVLTIEGLAELSRKLFPRGSESSVAYLRQLRDSP